MNKPQSVKVLIFLSLLQIVCLLIAIAIFNLFANITTTEGWLGGLRTGFLESAGFNPRTFGAYELGTAEGGILFELVFPSLMLYSIIKKRLWWIRGLAIFEFLKAIAAGGLHIVPLVMMVMAFLQGTTRYCKSK